MPSLSMPLFVSPEDVILRMQLNEDLPGLIDVVSSAIMAAELSVESLLKGHLIRESRNSLYYLDPESFSRIQPNGLYRLEIPSGFLRQDTPSIVTRGNRWNQITETVPSSLLMFDYKMGYVLVDAECNHMKYVTVQCDTGFEPGTNPLPVTGLAEYDDTLAYMLGTMVAAGGVAYTCIAPTQAGTGATPPNADFWTPATIPMEQLPQPVYEAIMTLVPSCFDSSQASNRSQEAEPQYKKGVDHALQLLKPWMRLNGFSFRPIV